MYIKLAIKRDGLIKRAFSEVIMILMIHKILFTRSISGGSI